jgi:hypothetical protein
MAPIARVTPRLDTAPEHSCGTWFRGGVITVGCAGCQRQTAATVPPARVPGKGLR